MKKMRKGFTLIELLLVIAIMGILSVMGMIAGQETTSAARATVIADNLEKLKTAGEMFYSENSAQIDKDGTLDGTTAIEAEQLAAGINNYLNTDNAIEKEAKDNQYFAFVDGSGTTMTWWVGYKFATSDENAQIRRAMKNKTNRMSLKKTTNVTTTTTGDNPTTNTANAEAYEGGDTVYMKVH